MCAPVYVEKVPLVHGLNMEMEGKSLTFDNLTIGRQDLTNETFLLSIMREVEESEITLKDNLITRFVA